MKVFILLVLFGYASFGFSQDSLRISKAHHMQKGFKNPNPEFEEHGYKSLAKWLLWDKFIKEKKSEVIDSVSFELAKNNPDGLKNNKNIFSVTWIGHSTLLIQLDGMNILTDPMWGETVSPVSFVGPRRLVKPGLKFKDLPKIDLVLISHNHYDHLDTETIEKLGNNPLYLIPIGLASYFEDLNITNYQELDWWETIKFNNIHFVSTPTQHFSGRNLFDRDKTLWCGWIIEGSKKIYFTGDSGYFPGFKEIGQKFGPFDVAAIPIGAFQPRWYMKSVYMDPGEAVDVYTDVKAKYFLPIHWGTFQLGDEEIKSPPRLLLEEVAKRKMEASLFRVLKHGETFFLPDTSGRKEYNASF